MKKFMYLLLATAIATPALADGMAGSVVSQEATWEKYQAKSVVQQTAQKKSASGDFAFYVTPRVGYGMTFFPGSEFSDGLVYGGAIGARLDKNWRVEFDVSHNKTSKIKKMSENVKAAQRNYSLNGYYDFCSDSVVSPFVGAGVGLTQTRLRLTDVDGIETAKEEDLMLSAQAGVNVKLVDGLVWETMGRYRYVDFDTEIHNAEVVTGLRILF